MEQQAVQTVAGTAGRTWRRRLLLAFCAMALLLVIWGLSKARHFEANTVLPHTPYLVSQDVGPLHQSLRIADLHCDTLLWNRPFLQHSPSGQADLPRLLTGNVAIQVLASVTSVPKRALTDGPFPNMDVVAPLAVLQGWDRASWTSPKQRALFCAQKLGTAVQNAKGALVWIRTSDDLRRFLDARAEGPHAVAALLAAEGLYCLEGNAANVDDLYHAGFRVMGFTHFTDNEFGGSSASEANLGLTEAGRNVLKRIDERKMIVDLAHASPQLIEDVLAATQRPVIVSHTGARGLVDTPRNLDDATLRHVAEHGGLIGVGYWTKAIGDASPANVAATLRYVIERAGIDHVALGSDFDGATTTAFDASELSVVTDALLHQGLSKEDIGKVMGENVIRLLLDALPQQ